MRLGLHINNPGPNNNALAREYIASVKPSVVKVLAEAADRDLLAFAKYNGAKTIFRRVLDSSEQSLDSDGRRQLARCIEAANGYQGVVDYVESFNERFDGQDDPKEIDKHAVMMREFIDMCGARGFRACIFNFSVGTPEIDRWSRDEVLKTIDYAGRTGAVIGLHEYYEENPYAMLEVAPGEDPAVAWRQWGKRKGWLMLRFVMALEAWRAAGVVLPQFVITESGADDIRQIPGMRRGWNAEPVTTRYADDMGEYMQHVSRWPEALGVVDFGFTAASKEWWTFDLSRAQEMFARMIAVQSAIPLGHIVGTPPPPPAPTPPPTPPPPPVVAPRVGPDVLPMILAKPREGWGALAGRAAGLPINGDTWPIRKRLGQQLAAANGRRISELPPSVVTVPWARVEPAESVAEIMAVPLPVWTAEDIALDALLGLEFGRDYRGWTGKDYQARHGGGFVARPRGTKVDRFVLHHSDSNSTSAEAIWRYHVRFKRWATAGYHIGVAPGGQVELLIPPSMMSYCVQDQNPQAVCVVALGRYEQDDPTPELLDAIYRVMCCLDDALGGEIWRGHLEVMPGHTACPGSHLIGHLRNMRGSRYGAADPRPEHYPL